MGWAARAQGGHQRRTVLVPYKVSAAASLKIVDMFELNGEETYDALLQRMVQGFWNATKIDRRIAPWSEATRIGVVTSDLEATSFVDDLAAGRASGAPVVLMIGKFPQSGNVARFVTEEEYDSLTQGKVDEDEVYWTHPPRQTVNQMPEHSTIQ